MTTSTLDRDLMPTCNKNVPNLSDRIFPDSVIGFNPEDILHFSSRRNLLCAMKDYIQSILALRKRNILHRDISLGNLILVDLEKRGYIINFDYAINILKHSKIARGGRSATIPFMAIDVLSEGTETDFEHEYYHDLESLFYVLIWICSTYRGPYDNHRPECEFDYENSVLNKWNPIEEDDDEDVAVSKYCTMANSENFDEDVLCLMDEYFDCMKDTLEELRQVLSPETSHERKKIHDGTISADEHCGRHIAILDKALQKDAVRNEGTPCKLDDKLEEVGKKPNGTVARQEEAKLLDIKKDNMAKEKQAAKAVAKQSDDSTATEGEKSSRRMSDKLRVNAIQNNMLLLKRSRESDASDSGYASRSTMDAGLSLAAEQEQGQEGARPAKKARLC